MAGEMFGKTAGTICGPAKFLNKFSEELHEVSMVKFSAEHNAHLSDIIFFEYISVTAMYYYLNRYCDFSTT